MSRINISADWTDLEWFLSDKFMESLRDVLGYPEGCNYIDDHMVHIIVAGVHWQRTIQQRRMGKPDYQY